MGDLGRLGDFSYDQAALSVLALDMASGKSIPLTGIESSARIPNSPMTVYLLAPLYALTDDPQMVTLLIAAWNVVGVGLLWWLAYRYFGARVALLAGLAYALHPHAIHYSRSIWAQDMHTPLIIIGFLLALRGFIEGKRWPQLLALPVLVVAMQVHYAAWTLLPVYLWIVWAGRKQIRWPLLVASIFIAAATMIPFAIGLAQSAETSATAATVIDQLDSLTLRNKALLYLARLATGLGGPWVGMPLIGEYDVVLDTPSVVAALWLLVGVAVVGGLVAVWGRWGRFRAVFLTLWAVLPFAVFVPNWTGVYPHYFIPNLPALALLAALGVDALLAVLPERPPLRQIAFGAFTLILLSQGWQYLLFLREVDAVDTALYPTPLHYLMDVRAPLRSVDDVIISGGTSGESGYLVWKGLTYRTSSCVRELVVASGAVAVFPDGPFAVISPPGALAPAAGDLYSTAASLIIPLRPGEGAYTVQLFDEAPDWNGPPITPIAPVRFDNQVQLTGYRLDENRVYLEWALPGEREQGYQYFAHFLDANGEKLGQQDASFWPPHFWCAGDRLILWTDADIPEATATLRVGMYYLNDKDHFVNSNVLDSGDNVVAPWTDIPLTGP